MSRIERGDIVRTAKHGDVGIVVQGCDQREVGFPAWALVRFLYSGLRVWYDISELEVMGHVHQE